MKRFGGKTTLVPRLRLGLLAGALTVLTQVCPAAAQEIEVTVSGGAYLATPNEWEGGNYACDYCLTWHAVGSRDLGPALTFKGTAWFGRTFGLGIAVQRISAVTNYTVTPVDITDGVITVGETFPPFARQWNATTVALLPQVRWNVAERVRGVLALGPTLNQWGIQFSGALSVQLAPSLNVEFSASDSYFVHGEERTMPADVNRHHVTLGAGLVLKLGR